MNHLFVLDILCLDISILWESHESFYIYIYAFSRRFYPKRLTLHSSYSFTFYQLWLSLGIEPMILALLAPCSTIWATGKPLFYCILFSRIPHTHECLPARTRTLLRRGSQVAGVQVSGTGLDSVCATPFLQSRW